MISSKEIKLNKPNGSHNWVGRSGMRNYTGRSIEKGLKDLEKHLIATADRDSDFIRVSMTCGRA